MACDIEPMQCVRCGKRAGYNRLVVDLVAGDREGGLCRNCEFDTFGRTLEWHSRSDGSCLCCDRDGSVGIARWRAEPDGESFSMDVTYHPRMPLLCDEHFQALKQGEPTATEEPTKQQS